jgi:hypothetical protein
MIIKLATFTAEEETQLRKKLADPSQIKSKQVLLNYAHPATILGGATGGFIGSEVGDKVFGGKHMTEMLHTPLGKTGPGITSRFAKNLFRGGLGAVGAGIGAYGVQKFREHKESK